MSKLRLLLVDDEPNVLGALRRLLRPLREEWDVRAASSATEALAMLEEQPAEVIISDMRMPETDGASFLAVVKMRFPSAVRIVLSGQTDRDAALRIVPIAHRFLSKPCDATELFDTLARARSAIIALGDGRVVAAVGGSIGSLPSPPAVVTQLLAMLADEDATATDLGRLVEGDPAIASKLLQLTNSSFFGLRRRISSVVEAVSYLGFGLVKNLVLALGFAERLPVRATRFNAAAFQQHSMRTGQLARYVAAQPDLADDCFAAGLFHDVGKLLLASALPARYDAVAIAVSEGGMTFEQAEMSDDAFPSHTQMGVYLLNLWGLPWQIVEAVANYEHAPQLECAEMGPAGTVYISHQLLGEASGELHAGLDLSFVDRLGLGSHVSKWRARAAELSGAGA